LIEMFPVDSCCLTCIFRGLMTVFVSASGTATPCDVTRHPNFDAISSRGLDASRDILGRHLLHESLSDLIAKFSLFSLRAVPTT